jgi:predicted O-methyltransferase YrrM
MQDREISLLCELAAQVPADREIVEVGSYAGGSAQRMAAMPGRVAHITCIDPWDSDFAGEEVLARFLAVVDWTAVTAFRGWSEPVAKMWLKPIGLLFIDAVHEYQNVLADYRAWAGFVAPGGWLVFHDYSRVPSDETPWTAGTCRVVNEVVVPSGDWTPVAELDPLLNDGGGLWAGVRNP